MDLFLYMLSPSRPQISIINDWIKKINKKIPFPQSHELVSHLSVELYFRSSWLSRRVSLAELTFRLLFEFERPIQTRPIHHFFFPPGTYISCVTSTKSATTTLRLPTLCCFTPNCSRYTDTNILKHTHRNVLQTEPKYTVKLLSGRWHLTSGIKQVCIRGCGDVYRI